MKFWKQPKFKELELKWYEAIKKDGFKDIEKVKGLPQTYKGRGQRHKVNVEAKHEYYLRLAHALCDNECDSHLDGIIMSMFAEGFTNREICTELGRLGKHRHRKTVMFIRRKYEDRWGIRKWRPDQLKSKVMPKKPRSRSLPIQARTFRKAM